MTDPVNVGLIGAGPWVRAVTGPVFAAGPQTRLAGIWSRTRGNAEVAGALLGAPVFDDVDALIDASDAVAIAVVPDAQPDLAIRAARTGKPVLLEKPLALELGEAQRLVEALDEHHVPSMLTLTYRYEPSVTAFGEAAAAFDAVGGRGCFLSGAFLPGSPYANGWRLERGALLDVGPHLLDLLELALGPITGIDARGDVHGWVSLTLEHASGVTSQGSLCCRAAIGSRTEVEVFGPAGSLVYDGRAGDRSQIGVTIRETFARVARGERTPIDAHHGLHLQRLLATAEAQLRG